MLSSPLNIPEWLEKNSHLLKPPVNNFCVYDKDVTVMVCDSGSETTPMYWRWKVSSKCQQIVGGPNARTDYHINETPEWFYQYKGAMILKVVDDGEFRDIIIGEGSMFLLPPNTPHNPVRFANTVGIVLEQHRPEKSIDRLRWYCSQCHEIVDEASFHCTDLGTQIKAAVNAFRDDSKRRTCEHCGVIADSAPPAGSIKDPNLV